MLCCNFAPPCGGYSAFRSTKSDKKFQKGLDFGGEESVTARCRERGPVLAPRDPAPLAMAPLRGFGGDGARCRYDQKDPPMSHSKSPRAKGVGKRSAKPE